jgi:hypothetical protein
MENRNLLLTRDSLGDVAYIYLRHPIDRGDVVRSELANVQTPDRTRVILGFDEYDRLLSIEVVGATKLLPPELFQPR